jgi:light-regulated signal transduction histidine kinase (bacteriophytochrome)
MTRVEIDAVLAFVGRERFWRYLLKRMKELAPERDLTRSLRDSAELAERALPHEVKEYVDHVRETFRAPIQRSIEKQFEGYREWNGGFQNLAKLEGGIVEKARTEAEIDTKALLPQMESEVRKVVERLGNAKPESD